LRHIGEEIIEADAAARFDADVLIVLLLFLATAAAAVAD